MAGGTTVALPNAVPNYSLERFFREAWPVLEGGRPLDWNWHLAELCRVLEAFYHGTLTNKRGREVTRLALNVAPGFTKSMLCSVIYPVWCLSQNPAFQVITASNAMQLATRDSLKSNELVKSEWFQERWGAVVVIDPRQDVKTNWMTKAGGRRVATSPYSRFTGWRADMQIWDDLLDADDRHSKHKRDHVLEWSTGKMSNRLNDERTGKILAVGQRLHKEDHFGRKKDDTFPGGGLQQRDSWDHVIIATVKERPHPKNTVELDDPREPGDFLHPTRYAEKEWAKTKEDLGTRGRKCQHQQNPDEDEGGIFKRLWWKRFEAVPHLARVILSVDASFGATGPDASFVVIQAWGIAESDGHFYLLDQYRRRSDFVDSWKAVAAMAQKWEAAAILVEDKANGPAIISFLKKRGLPGVIPYQPKGSKQSRWNAAAPVVESGWFHVPVAELENIMGRRPWKEGDFGEEVRGEVPERSDPDVLIDECADCPDGDTDDTVDALAQLVDWVHLRSNRVRTHTGRIR